jgi:EcsC protein family
MAGIEGLTDKIAQIMADIYEAFSVDPGEMVIWARMRGYDVNSVGDFKLLQAEHRANLCRQVVRSTQAISAAEGAAFGTTGILTILPDISELLRLNLRMLQKLAYIHGVDPITEEGRLEIMKAFAYSMGVDSVTDESGRTLSLASGQQFMRSWTSRALLLALTKSVARALAGRFGRKAMLSLPILGAVIGGAINLGFTKDVGRLSTEYFEMTTSPKKKKSPKPRKTTGTKTRGKKVIPIRPKGPKKKK